MGEPSTDVRLGAWNWNRTTQKSVFRLDRTGGRDADRQTFFDSQIEARFVVLLRHQTRFNAPLCPIWLDGWPVVSISAFGISLLFLTGIHTWIRYQLTVRRSHWMLRVTVTCVTFVCMYALLSDSPLGAVVLGSGLVAFAIYIGEGWLSRHPYLSQELERSEALRMAFDRAVLSTSGAIEKPSRRKRPLYRPRPNRFGSARRTSAILLYIRTPRHRNLWLRLVPLAVTGMLLVPSWFKLLIPLYVGYVMWQERQAFKQEMERHPFFRAIQERTDL